MEEYHVFVSRHDAHPEIIFLSSCNTNRVIYVCDSYVGPQNAGGKLALSGMLEEQADDVLAAYADDFDLQVTDKVGGWALVSGLRRGGK